MDAAGDCQLGQRLRMETESLHFLPMSRMSLYPVWSSARQPEAYLQLIRLHL